MPIHEVGPKKSGDAAAADPPPPGASALHAHDVTMQSEHHVLKQVSDAATQTMMHEVVGPHPDHVDGTKPAHHEKLDPKVQAAIDQVNAINAHLLEQTHEIQAKEEAKQKAHALKHQINGPAAIAIASNLSRLAFSMNDSNSKAFIQQLDAITDPDLRAQVKEQFKVQHMGEDLEHFIRHNEDWNNSGDNRDARAALRLISTERDQAEQKLEDMDPKQRDALRKKAKEDAAKFLAAAAAHDHSDANMQKIFGSMEHKSPEEIELMRQAVQEVSAGHTNMYQAIDDGTHNADEDEAIAMLEGNPVKSARAALTNETDPKRLREVLRKLTPSEAAQLDPFFKAQVLARFENPADRAELGAMFGQDSALADAEHLGNLLKPKSQGVGPDGEFNPYSKVDQENYDRRKPKNVIKEFEGMSGEQVAAAAAAWDKAHKNDPGFKSFKEMLKDRWGDDDDPTEFNRLTAMIDGDKEKNRSIRFQEGLREKDQDEIEASLAHDAPPTTEELNSPDQKVKDDAQKRLADITKREAKFDALNIAEDQKQRKDFFESYGIQPTAEMLAPHDTRQQINNYYDAREKDDIGSSWKEDVTGGAVADAIHAKRQSDHEKEVKDHRQGALDMLDDGHLSVAVEMHRAKSAKDKLAVVEKLKDNDLLAAQEKKALDVYGEPLIAKSDDTREDMSTAELQLDNVLKYGVKSQRPAQLEHKLQAQIIKHSYSSSLEAEEAGRLGTQSLERYEYEAQSNMLVDPGVKLNGPTVVTDPVTGMKMVVEDPHEASEADIEASLPKEGEYTRPTHDHPLKPEDDGLKAGVTKEEFNQQDEALSMATEAQQDAKKRMAERLIKIFSTIAKIAAALTLQPELIAAIDIAEGVLEIVIKKEIIGKDYSMKDDLKMLAITGVADIALMGFAKYGKGAAKVAEEAALKEAEQFAVHEAEAEVANVAKSEVEAEVKHEATAELEHVAQNEIEQKVTQAAESKVAGEVETEAAKEVEQQVAKEVENEAVKDVEHAAENAAKEQLNPAEIAKKVEAQWGMYGNAAKMVIQTVGGGIATGKSPGEILKGLVTGGLGLVIPGAVGEKIRGAIGNEVMAAKVLGELLGTSGEYISALTINIAGGADPADAALDTAIGVGGGRAQHAFGGHGGGGKHEESSSTGHESAAPPEPNVAAEKTVTPEPAFSPEPRITPEPSVAAGSAVAPEPAASREPIVTPPIAPEVLAAPASETPKSSESHVAPDGAPREAASLPEPAVVAEPDIGPTREVESLDVATTEPVTTAPEAMSIGGSEPEMGSRDSGTPNTELRNDGTDYRRGANAERTINKASEKLAAMDTATRSEHAELFQRTESVTQQALLERAIAAGATYEQLHELVGAMAGKPDSELLLTMTGAGLIQLYQASCVPTSYQIGIADKNPVFALEMHRNPKAAFEAQGEALQQAGGRRTPRDNMASPPPELQRYLDNPELSAALKQDSAFDPSKGIGPDGKRHDGIDPSRMKDTPLHKQFEAVHDSKYQVLGNTDVAMANPDGRFESSNLPHDRMQRALDKQLPILAASGNHQQTIIGYEKNGSDVYYIIDDPDTAGTKRVSAKNLDASDVQALTMPVDEESLMLAPELGPIANAESDAIGAKRQEVPEAAIPDDAIATPMPLGDAPNQEFGLGVSAKPDGTVDIIGWDPDKGKTYTPEKQLEAETRPRAQEEEVQTNDVEGDDANEFESGFENTYEKSDLDQMSERAARQIGAVIRRGEIRSPQATEILDRAVGLATEMYPPGWTERTDAAALSDHAYKLAKAEWDARMRLESAIEARNEIHADEMELQGRDADDGPAPMDDAIDRGHRNQVNEIEGERAATEYMLSEEPDAQLVKGYNKGTGYDQVWIKSSGGGIEIIIVEGKSAGAELRQKGSKGPQMSNEWVRATAEEMLQNPETEQLGRDILVALADRKVGSTVVTGRVLKSDGAGSFQPVTDVLVYGDRKTQRPAKTRRRKVGT